MTRPSWARNHGKRISAVSSIRTGSSWKSSKLFLERPQLIALSADLPNPGDYYATDIAGKPILIVRGKEGKAKAFLNACRHRGVKLADEGCGHGQGFTCPYHWLDL